jgi:hypothetical protein
MNEPHYCGIENAAKLLDWIRNRGGVAVWRSIDFSSLGRSWSTPLRQKDGTPSPTPHPWKSEATPSRVITDPAEILVFEDKLVRRFHVAVRRGDSGLLLKLTDASTGRVRKAVEHAGKGAYYEFDYGAQEAVIMAPVRQLSLAEWAEENTL